MATIPFVQFNAPIIPKKQSFWERFGEQVLAQGVQTAGNVFMQSRAQKHNMKMAEFADEKWWEQQIGAGNIVEWDEDMEVQNQSLPEGLRMEVPTVMRGEQRYAPGVYVRELDRIQQLQRPASEVLGQAGVAPIDPNLTVEGLGMHIQAGTTREALMDPDQESVRARLQASAQSLGGVVQQAEQQLPPNIQRVAPGLQAAYEAAIGEGPVSLAESEDTAKEIQFRSAAALQSIGQAYSMYARDRDYNYEQRMQAIAMSTSQILMNPRTGDFIHITPQIAEFILTDHPWAVAVMDKGGWKLSNAPAGVDMDAIIQDMQKPEAAPALEAYFEVIGKAEINRDVNGAELTPDQFRTRFITNEPNARAIFGGTYLATQYQHPEELLAARRRGIAPLGTTPLMLLYAERVFRARGWDKPEGYLVDKWTNPNTISDSDIQLTQEMVLARLQAAEAAMTGDENDVTRAERERQAVAYLTGETDVNPLEGAGLLRRTGALLGPPFSTATEHTLQNQALWHALGLRSDPAGGQRRTREAQNADVRAALSERQVGNTYQELDFRARMRDTFTRSPQDTARWMADISQMHLNPDYTKDWLQQQNDWALEQGMITPEQHAQWGRDIDSAGAASLQRFAASLRFDLEDVIDELFRSRLGGQAQ